ncbi:hypothetical protein [Dyella sp.]|uniref:hypothetical protein n=1 Tax=Dyella sp. TaxID=1869338 RepID=UPI0028483647|nr:hypothetical protein [Dyella sp.]MDR3444721.1 hypothetical protein [Dyella sp.]
MIVADRTESKGDVAAAVKAALARIQRATQLPDLVDQQPGAWIVSWPSICVAWVVAALLAYCRFTGRIQ